ncbi:2-oxoglutarate:acceptor oxidoreductase [Campylobacter sp. 2018MI35]|uniref:CiaD-like domain-containing protein n=1 Tax=unclassified Campylobacter TaxID=2593542 RepID=UPI0019060A26|nr:MULTISPECIES: 2-oxoglutarate:acceptor oxidoreductase [unclassified Campylobacter]MBK1971021.1 2-oxoglutarate:acceptor oxidoreductase [Campylobacter sp. TTU_617]MBK1991360.1 2-oxoglutarate:acceptor oxidoreductase [Campylobacter sp. 2018MI34]
MNIEDLAKKTIDEISIEIKEKERQKSILEEQQKELNIQNKLNEIHTKESKEEFPSVEEISIQEQDNEIENDILKEQTKEFQNEKKLQISQENNNFLENIPQIDEAYSYIQEIEENVLEKKENLNYQDDIFLKNLRERILVLFEGLNSVKKDKVEQKLTLTINFLEFLLAKIEDKLKK